MCSYTTIHYYQVSECIGNHKSFKVGVRIWKDMEDCIMNEEISVTLLPQVKKYETEISLIFASLHLSNRNADDREKWQSICLSKINELVETEKNVRDKLELLENALKFAGKVLTGPGHLPTEILDRKNNLRTMKIRELNEDFWGPHMPLLEKLDSLRLAMESISFTNISKIYLEESEALKCGTSEDNKHNVANLQLLFEVLSTEGIHRFETEWNQVLFNPDSQTVKGMIALLGDLNVDELDHELSVLEDYFKGQLSSNVKLYIKDCVTFSRILDQVKHIISLMEAFDILNPERSELVSTMTTFVETFDGNDEVVVADLHEPMKRVEEIISQCDINETIDVIMELGKGLDLVNFLKEIVDEDIRVLIDAVEEHSDQSVSVSLVSDLIQVHGFLATVIKKCDFSPDLVLTTLVDESKKQPMMSIKICQCRLHVHSLKALYQNVANREEMTRDIIMNCLNDGVFDIVLDKNGIKITMSYNKDGDNSVTKSMSELHDLRSRAHLIISSSDVHKREINYADFIEQVNILSEIEEAIVRLQSSGHIKYQNARHWPKMKETEYLEQLNNTLREELDTWEESLRKARQEHYYLNYYWSNQLCVLYKFLTNPDRTQVDFENVITLIHFVDPTIDENLVHDYGKSHVRNLPDSPQDAPDEIMSVIGKALGSIFQDVSTRPDLPDTLGDASCRTSSVKGNFFVAVLEEESLLTVNVMMSLYENTTKGYPEPSQVIFCSPHTKLEEIQIFLRRCFTQTSLFCLANVELLTNEVQFEVVDFIKKQYSEDGDLCYKLAIICRGGDHHHIVEEFSKFSDHVLGMSYPDIAKRFKTRWPDVKFVTSTLPGLGKTEFIRQDALDKGMNVVTFPISGQLDLNKIIQRLKQLDLKDFHCLHFDIGEVDDPLLLDTFLFQLIVTGMVSFGTQLYRLPKTGVYIEIANSLNDHLSESLAITQCFTRVQLQWRNFDNLEVSSKITSDIQVVSQYLHALECGRLESIDIHFSGRHEIKPLSANRCRELLLKYYSTNAGTTFTALNTFLGLLADQLRKFSRSTFFTIENLKLMLEDKASGVRRNLLTALLDVSRDFAARSLKTCSSSHHQEIPLGTSAQHMVQRVEGMIQWEESNHLLIVFHGVDSQTIAAFYRDKRRVPQNVSELLKSQIVKGRNKELEDFKEMNHGELHSRLERIARVRHSGVKNQEETDRKVSSSYALTPDNMLKMILIILRVRANVPIIIMGETGCGKTSLVQYLADLCQIPFFIYNFHAGRTEEEVKRFIEDENDKARKAKGQRWVFLDEINTCHHLGLISEIMCRHTLYGEPLSKKLVMLAACNPYKLRPLENATTAGLEGKNKTDEYSELVYRVHPLPEAMVDYVWDYGSLTPQDEKAYIQRMVQNLPSENQQVLVDLLANSQAFIRESEEPYSVSLRDVRRCILLVKWFMDIIAKRTDLMKRKSPLVFDPHLKIYQNLSRSCKPVIKSIVLALAHCYLSRLQTEEMREKYINCMTALIPGISKEIFSAIIRMEQEDYLRRMELPPGTAKNAALRENVFVMLVSILNRIPVFVVGKPGCSKSLAIQLIKSNLRGKDSQDPFFKNLPHLYVVSYQGSESSTSEGISEIFKMASSYKDHNQNANVLPVVLLDEVGLAENSPNNPLKVLHSILEPGKGELPDVAVVGISNWALDAAKMNRAIHLSRPEPTIKDLEETAISLCEDNVKSNRVLDASTKKILNCLAKAYHEYQCKQGHANFHGLRDYYSLVKSLSTDRCHDMNEINVVLQRNFGGIPVESSKVQPIFKQNLQSHVTTSEKAVSIPVTKLIQANLDDPKARHLMLITNGDSAVGILKQNLSHSVKQIITIFGSRFEEDMSDDYNYRMLSRIILCMERDCVLILRDLECIYGSLYDMLNQNYSVVGKRKNCRVALGAYSNPMCYVNDSFRCIVLVDHDKVNYADPPFLNRFEKQLLRFSDVLNERQQEIILELQLWVRQMSSVEGLDEQIKESDMFMGFHEDTLPSLVLLHGNDTNEAKEVIIKKCKDDLMWIATPDGVLRTHRCEHLKENPREVEMHADEYFNKPIHNGLAYFMKYFLKDQEFPYSTGDEVGSKLLVMTYATVHTDIIQCLDGSTITYQLERLGAYKSEKQLEDRVHNFYSSDKDLLVVQCTPELDGEHMLLARSVIEDKRNSYAKTFQELGSTRQAKHVCILVHVPRAVKERAVGWQLNFLSGWKQVFLDALDVPSISLNEIRNETINSLLTSSVWSFRRFAVNCILWCFNCIKYTQNPRRKESILKIAKGMFASKGVTTAVQKLVLQHVSPSIDEVSGEEGESWQVNAACDLKLLLNSSTLTSAMEEYIASLISQPLAQLVYFLERENAWPPHLFTSRHELEYEEEWCGLLLKSSIFNINDIPKCLGHGGYSISGARLNLRVPFSQVIYHNVDAARSLIMTEYTQATGNEMNYEDGVLKENAKLEQLHRYSEILRNVVPCLCKFPGSFLSSYMADVLEITSADFKNKISNRQRILFSSCAFLSFADKWLPIKEKDPLQFYALLHLFVWTSEDRINYLLEIVNCSQSLAQPKRLERLAKDFFLENQQNLPLVEDESIDERIDFLWNKRRSSESDSDESDSETSDSDSNDSEENISNSSEIEESDNDSSESSSSEDETESIKSNEEEDESFEDMLVNFISENMFPSKKTVIKNGGLESWIRNSSLFVSLVEKIGNRTPAYQFLCVCVNYAKMVVKETRISEEYLYVLNDIAKQLNSDYLDEDSSFHNMTEALIEPVEQHLRGQEEKHTVLQRFICQFYCRCLETNVETASRCLIVKHVLSLQGQDVLIMTPVMYRLLFAEEAESPGVFVDIIIDQRVNVKHSCLKVIDDVFREYFGNGKIHHDSYPAVMICDLIYSIQDFDAHIKKDELTSLDSHLMKCFRCATNVVTGSEDNIGLVFLSSVAFLRGFYTMLSKQPSILIIKTPYSPVMSEINSLLAVGGARRSSMQMFFLKKLYAAGMTMFDISKLCCDSDQLPVLQNHFEQDKIFTKAELASVYCPPEYDEVKTAYENLANGNESEMVEILLQCKKSENHRLALFGILINMIYVKKAVSNLSDKEERLLRWFSDKSKDLPSPFKELLMKIIGYENFNHHGLQISLASSTDEIETALLILHISCVVASCVEGDDSALFQYFANPENCYGTCILAHGKNRKRRVFDKFTFYNESPPITCSCRLRIKGNHDQEQNLCPSCGTKTVSEESEVTSSEQNKIYCLETKSKEWQECTENMDTYVYRALDLIVYACFYAGVATRISSDEDLALLLCPETEGSTCRKGKDGVADFCLNRIKEDLQCLMIILSCKSRPAVDAMHLLVEKCTELIQGKIVNKGTFSTTEECLEWENEFTEIAKAVLPDAIGSTIPLREALKDSNEERSSIEKEIQEIDEYPFDPEQQNADLKRLFRLTKEPSFTESRSIFLVFEHFHEQHSLLSVLFSKFDELPYLTCLYPLLHWSRLVSSALTHRISRKEAESKFINDFIDGHVLHQDRNKEERKELRELFNDFRDAWNRMREFVNQNLDHDEMPHLTDDSSIGYCLTEGDLSIYLRMAIKILQAIQNNILDEMIITSVRTGNPALSFLQKSETYCAITSVSLQEAKHKDIINFEWSDKFLRYAQNPSYGDGEQIDYDFEQIEIQLANEIGLGKCFFTDSLNPFIFSQELFHSSAKVLEKIHEVCPQKALPEEIRQGLYSLQERRKQDARILLQDIEVVIYLLNIKSISSKEAREMSLVMFAETWKAKLPSPFPAELLPEPKASIKLAHIAALYEALEDLLADGSIEGLPRSFRKELTEATAKLVDGLVDSRNGSIKLRQLLRALRRFVFRYLSADKFLPEPHTPLRSHLSEPSLWSPDQVPDQDVIPREIILENIYAVIAHLQEVIM